MKLEQATNELAKAMEAEDLASLESALDARQAAMHRGERPTREILETGNRALLGLAAFRQRLAADLARLGHVRAYLDRDG